MITSVPNSNGIKILSSDVDVELPFESFVKTHRIITISQSVIKKTVSRVNDTFFETVIAGVSDLIKLDK
ncbi:MAG: hypothetical protein HRU03_05975 [Nanoarchaeales archaeon]|nr:hypothetical protein [Nanoarchaeales archaeon]